MTKYELPGSFEMLKFYLLIAGTPVIMALALVILATSTNHALQWTGALHLVAGTVVGAVGIGFLRALMNFSSEANHD